MPAEDKPRRLVAVKPIILPVPGREPALEVKVTAPADGESLPVLVFSHGRGWSMDGYEPLVDPWARAGFIVVQPTHLDSRRYGIGFDDPRFGTIWRMRITDLHAILDALPEVLEEAGVAARADLANVVAVGHSWGAQAVGTLLGARVLDEEDRPGEDMSHPAVRAGVLIGVTGTGDSLTPFAREHLSFMRPDYSHLSTPTLVIAGGKDQSQLSTRGPDWFTDAYRLSPGARTLAVLPEAEHTFGGIAGEAVAETTDEDPQRVALVADLTSAFLRDAVGSGDTAWREVTGSDSVLIEQKGA